MRAFRAHTPAVAFAAAAVRTLCGTRTHTNAREHICARVHDRARDFRLLSLNYTEHKSKMHPHRIAAQCDAGTLRGRAKFVKSYV